MSRNRVNLHDVRLQLFGPTLDDSVLYGIDRMIDCFRRRKGTAREPLRSGSFYRSCETFPLHEPNAVAAAPSLIQPIAPKLSPDEMDLIIDAIVQSRRNSQKYARKTRSEKRSEPRLRQTRWALARINEFDDGGKTFEIMKPLDGTEEGLPGTVPLTDTEIVFAVLQNGNTLTYRAHRPQPAEQSR